MGYKDYKISPLKGTSDYTTWSIRAKASLVQEGLANAIVNEVGNGLSVIQNQKALTHLQLLCSDNIIEQIQEYTSCKQAWEYLMNTYKPEGFTTEHLIIKDFFNSRLENFESVEDYVHTLKNTLSKLKAKNVSLEQLAMSWILYSLTADYTIQEPDFDPSFDTAMASVISSFQNSNPDFQVNTPSSQYVYNITKRDIDRLIRKKNEIQAQDIDTDFVIDSGATIDVISNKSLFHTYKSCYKEVNWGDAKTLKVKGIGNLVLKDKYTHKLQYIRNAYYVPELGINLISVRKLKNIYTIFDEERVTLVDKSTSNILSQGHNNNGLYYLPLKAVQSRKIMTTQPMKKKENYKNPLIQWHNRLGHISLKPLIISLQRANISYTKSDIQNFVENKCITCIEGSDNKHRNKQTLNNNDYNVHDRIHSDLGGPLPTTYNGYKYYITFLDRKSRYLEITLLKTKSEAQEAFHNYRLRAERTNERPIKEILTDNGSEYINRSFEIYLNKLGIIHNTTPAYTKEPNGLIERINKTLMTKVRLLISTSNLPSYLWGEALYTAVYLYNRTPHKSLDYNTPFEVYFQNKEYITHLYTWGSLVYYNNNKRKSKLEPRNQPGYLVGYGNQNNLYKVFDMNNKKSLWVRDVTILENKFYTGSNTVPQPEITIDLQIPEDQENRDNNQQEIQQDTIRSVISTMPASTIPQEQEHIEDCITVNTDRILITIKDTTINNLYSFPDITADYILSISSDTEPNSLREALQSPEKDLWYKATIQEIQEIENQNVYTITDLPKGHKALGGRWIFKLKTTIPEYVKDHWITNKDHTKRYKARYVIQGFNQILGIDYLETFSTTARSETWHMLLIIAVNKGWFIIQFDVKNAFLHSDIDSEIYIKLPEGHYTDPKYKNKVAKLNKALYGLKQAPRLWYQHLATVLYKLGFQTLPNDEGVFIHPILQAVLICHVDDILILNASLDVINDISKDLERSIKIEEVGPVSSFLGNDISINRDNKTIHITQKGYIQKLLNRYGITKDNGYNPSLLPGTPGLKLQKSDIQASSPSIKDYQQQIGSLLYLALKTRVDITYNVCRLARYMANPNNTHFSELKRLWGYIMNTPELGIIYDCSGDNIGLKGYTDASWADNIDDRKSTSGYIFSLGHDGANNPISWVSQLQKTVALSTCEAEYMGIRDALKEALYLKEMFDFLNNNLSLGYTASAPILLTDNESAKRLANNPEFHKKTKHIQIAYHFNREVVTQGLVEVHWINTKEQLADVLTKILPKPQFKYLISKIQI
jgi:hypothetical protein